MIQLPKATPKPCADCPWRRVAAPGWLGPMSPDEWIALAHSDHPIACHKTILDTDETGTGAWDHPGVRQCFGAAQFRVNVFKSPRNPTDAEHAIDDRDTATVFGTDAEFLDYHRPLYERLYEPARRKRGEL